MKVNNKILTVLIILIAILSISTVSANEDIDNLEMSDNNLDIESVNNDVPLVAKQWDIPASATADEIQSILDEADEGDTISFYENAVYDLGTFTGSKHNGLQVEKTLTIIGNNATITAGKQIDSAIYFGGISIDGREGDVSGTTVRNLNIDMTNVEPWQGYGLSIYSGEDITIENCIFHNGASGITPRNCIGNIIIRNCTFYGSADESQLGASKEVGVKAVNIMGGSGITVTDCYFNEGLLDGVSMASNARNITVTNNIFYKNWYGTYNGGGVNDFLIKGNVFDNDKIYSIALIKSAGDGLIADNSFFILKNNSAIYIEQNNTAHGYPSTIENINIEKNLFIKGENGNDDAIAVRTYSPEGILNPNMLSVSNNTYEKGISVFSFKEGASGYGMTVNRGTYNNGTATNIIIEDNKLFGSNQAIIVGENATIATKIGNRFEITLKDSNNYLLVNQTVAISVNGRTYYRTTDENGVAGLNINLNMGQHEIKVKYTGNEALPAENTYTINVVQAKTKILSNITTISAKGQRFTAKLVDESGKALSGQAVAFHINGVKYYRITDENGEFSIAINLDVTGIYNMFMSFDGTLEYARATGGSQITCTY